MNSPTNRPDVMIFDDVEFKNKTPRKPLCIYHHNCADGFCAATIFKYWSGVNFDFHPGIYQSPAPEDIEGRDVYLVDFSYKRPVVEAMLEKAATVTLIDHHKTALEDLEPLMKQYDYAGAPFRWYATIEKSGAMLAWEYWQKTFNPDFDGEQLPEAPPLIKTIQDRDLWQFKLARTREVQANIFSYPYDFDIWYDMITRSKDKNWLENFADQGEAIERKHFKDMRELVDASMRRIDIELPPEGKGLNIWHIAVANVPYTLSSDAGHYLMEHHHQPFGACYMDMPDGRVFSLRSNDSGPDVSAIAKYYGGGGHRNAAGFKVPRDHILAQV